MNLVESLQSLVLGPRVLPVELPVLLLKFALREVYELGEESVEAVAELDLCVLKVLVVFQ